MAIATLSYTTREKPMDVVEDTDGSAACEADLAPCPFCEAEDCKHEVLWHSRGNCDWYGLLADKTKTLQSELEAALCACLEAPWEEGGSMALLDLWDRAAEGFDGTVDSISSSALHGYWLGLADDDSDATVIRVDWDGGGPGSSDAFFHVYFEEPAKGVEAVLRKAKDDLAFLKSLAPSQKR